MASSTPKNSALLNHKMDNRMKKRKNLWPLGITIIYIAFACGILTLVSFAGSSDMDMVSPTYYKESLKYQDVIDATSNANLLKYQPEITLEHHSLKVDFNKITDVASCESVELYSPSNSSEDQRSNQPIVDNKLVSIPLNKIRSGNWIVKVSWRDSAQKRYIYNQEFNLK
jgi:nitrogen fixation protein FixH